MKPKEYLRKKLRDLMNQIEEKKVIYKKKLAVAQKSDEELEKVYLEIKELINKVIKKKEELENLE